MMDSSDTKSAKKTRLELPDSLLEASSHATQALGTLQLGSGTHEGAESTQNDINGFRSNHTKESREAVECKLKEATLGSGDENAAPSTSPTDRTGGGGGPAEVSPGSKRSSEAASLATPSPTPAQSLGPAAEVLRVVPTTPTSQ